MDYLSNLKPAKGSMKNRKRVGRGPGSGHGKTSTRGENGQRSRSGAKFRLWFEGGQMPLQRRVPKFGFTPPFRVEFQVINLFQIQKALDAKKPTETVLDATVFRSLGLISTMKKPYKILAYGEITSQVSIVANAFSESAKAKIEAAGGTITTI